MAKNTAIQEALAKLISVKLWVWTIAFVGVTVLVALGSIDKDLYAEIVKWVTGLFMGANVGSKFARAIGNGKEK